MTTQTWPFTLEVTEETVPGGGFLGTINPVTLTVPAGTLATYQISFVDVDPEFAGEITLAVLGLPDEALATFSIDNPVFVTDTVTLTIETDLVLPGTYEMQIEATYEW